jgi:hypothetical protein
MSVAEDRELDRQLTECLRNGPSVQLVNEPPKLPDVTPGPTPAHWPVGYIQADPNHTRADVPHPTPVLDALRAAANNPELSEQDREAAKEVLRISFHTKD